MKKLLVLVLLLGALVVFVDACVLGGGAGGQLALRLPSGDLLLVSPQITLQRITPRPPEPEPEPGIRRLPTTKT